MKIKYILYKLVAILLLSNSILFAENIFINHDQLNRKITFGNNKISIVLEYNKKCNISELKVNNQTVISSSAGIYSEVTTQKAAYSTLQLNSNPLIEIEKEKITINKIIYGEDDEIISETWIFNISESDIKFNIERNFNNNLILEEVAFPSFNFDNINVWDGAFLSYGGIAWFYLFNQKLCTYGVHSNSSAFWNSTNGNGLNISVESEGNQIAMKYTRANDDILIYNISISDEDLTYRYEAEKRSRFIRGKTDVWDSFKISKKNYDQTITLSFFDYNKDFDRGNFKGINEEQVTNLLNTVARIGVIDKNLFGGNSWHTPYGPICLHEQYIADFAIGVNDEKYIEGYKQCLDYYKDNAIQKDGRVIARWAYLDEDAIPGSITEKGFYEAQWGYLMDSNPDFVSNVAQLFNISGDLNWVSKHKKSCESALEYLMQRDSNNNYLVEMMSDSKDEKRGSDWIDIIWASYENAFVNAKLYYALTLWTDVEMQLNDADKANYYAAYAAELKKSFNKSVNEGGFWNDKNKWYVHWREKDNSIHGDNLVVPVNFMAIVYGICDDEIKRNSILDKIEEQTSKENLFFWPICLYPYTIGEGNDWQFPFPNYENGDLFLSWGSIGVEAYANYKPELAIKYVNNVLDQYAKDGLAFQRYGRVKQDGLGDDILSGNSLAIIGLYKAVYGINPQFNRLYLNPNLIEEIAGTELFYNFRNDKLAIKLNTNNYSITNDQFEVKAKTDFGYYSLNNELYYFDGDDNKYSLKAISNKNLLLDILSWNRERKSWIQLSKENNSDKIKYEISNLESNKNYSIYLNNKLYNKMKSDNGILNLELDNNENVIEIIIDE
ncbi:MAG: hypothetical protein IPM32_15490 [Ignavibacteriae bacterium]|nr:hypothetical protein [Ignavibacteriota bacterium]